MADVTPTQREVLFGAAVVAVVAVLSLGIGAVITFVEQASEPRVVVCEQAP